MENIYIEPITIMRVGVSEAPQRYSALCFELVRTGLSLAGLKEPDGIVLESQAMTGTKISLSHLLIFYH